MNRKKSNPPQVILDTNVFVSALLIPTSVPAKILQSWQQNQISLIISKDTYIEIEAVLSRTKLTTKYSLKLADINSLLQSLNQAAILIESKNIFPLALSRDIKDDIFLALALASQADYLITGDKDLLILNHHPNLKKLIICTPKAFFDLFSL